MIILQLFKKIITKSSNEVIYIDFTLTFCYISMLLDRHSIVILNRKGWRGRMAETSVMRYFYDKFCIYIFVNHFV